MVRSIDADCVNAALCIRTEPIKIKIFGRIKDGKGWKGESAEAFSLFDKPMLPPGRNRTIVPGVRRILAFKPIEWFLSGCDFRQRLMNKLHCRLRNMENFFLNIRCSAMIFITAFWFMSGTPEVFAQEIEPRAYSNAPVGVNFFVAGFAATRGGIAFDHSLPVQDPQLYTYSPVLAYARVLDLWGMSGKVDAILPYTWLHGSAQREGLSVERDSDGFADARFRLSINLYGAPALTLKKFSKYRQDLILGASLQVSVPSGEYDPDKLVNIGTNRWSLKTELGLSKAIGPWTLEAAAAAIVYTDNNDFFKGKKRSQDPLYSFQGHAIYNIRPGIWASLDATYFAGGRTTIDGIRNSDLVQNWRVGATLALPVNARNSMKFYASSGVWSRTGNDYDLIGIAWQYRWGGGL
jgi:hypothetical protein